MSARELLTPEPLFAPPVPGSDLRTMLRRRIVATAWAQLTAGRAERAKLSGPAPWRRYAQTLRGRFAASLASVNFHPAKGPVRAKLVSRRTFPGFSIENILFESLPGWWVNATVWKPDPKRWPAPWRVIVTPVGHNGKYNPSEQFPPQVFAANGFMAVSFDPPGFGEKVAGNNHFEDGVRCYPGGINSLAFFLADCRRVIDYVSGRPDADVREGVAMTGVSGGGFSSITCAIVDKRVRIIAPSCYGMPDELHPVRDGYAGCPECLWFGRFASGLGLIELMIAARFVPMLLMAGARDTVMTGPIMRKLGLEAKAAYRAAGAGERVGILIDDCGHEYTVRQAETFVRWVQRWWGGAERVRSAKIGNRRSEFGREAHGIVRVPKPRLLPQKLLECHPPRKFTMASFAARKASEPAALKPAVAKARLRALAGLDRTEYRRPLRAVSGKPAHLWVHAVTEVCLRDGPNWELPATWVRRKTSQVPEHVLVWFDARGRWTALHQWGWLDRAVGFFAPSKVNLSVLSVDLPGWGDTAPTPSPWDVVGWGGVDRWIAYLSAATGDSVMAMRLREACRVLRHVRTAQVIPARRLFVGGHGLGANIAALAAWLEGPVAGMVLMEPLTSFAELVKTPKPTLPHDAYFPEILKIADFPAALRAAKAPAIVVGPLDGCRQTASRALQRPLTKVPHCTLVPTSLNADAEARVIEWLHARIAR